MFSCATFCSSPCSAHTHLLLSPPRLLVLLGFAGSALPSACGVAFVSVSFSAALLVFTSHSLFLLLSLSLLLSSLLFLFVTPLPCLPLLHLLQTFLWPAICSCCEATTPLSPVPCPCPPLTLSSSSYSAFPCIGILFMRQSILLLLLNTGNRFPWARLRQPCMPAVPVPSAKCRTRPKVSQVEHLEVPPSLQLTESPVVVKSVCAKQVCIHLTVQLAIRQEMSLSTEQIPTATVILDN